MITVMLSAALFHFHAAQAGSAVDQFRGCGWHLGQGWQLVCRKEG
jgi:hypothetical protein